SCSDFLAAISFSSAAISARFSKKIFTVGASMTVMAIITTAKASMRPEKARAGTGAWSSFRDPLLAACAPALYSVRYWILGLAFACAVWPDARPVVVLFLPLPGPLARGAWLSDFPAPDFTVPGLVVPDLTVPGLTVPCLRESGLPVFAGSDRPDPNSARMTSPPSALSLAGPERALALGTLGRRVAM